jgi:RHS repeat-associated protein
LKSLRLFLAVVVLLCVTLRVASAQSDPANSALDTGLKPYGSYHGGELDSVNLTNGNLTVHIAIASYPQRGALGYSPRVTYNNKGWYVVPNCNKTTGICSPYWAWKGNGVSLDMSSEHSFGVGWQPASPGSFTLLFTATTADGSVHQLAGNQTGGMSTIDGTGIWYDGSAPSTYVQGLARDRHGNTSVGNGPLEDSNGNQLAYPSSSTLADTVGRTFPLGGANTTDFSGCIGSLPTASAGTYTLPGFGAANRMIKVCYAAISLQSHFQTSGYYNSTLTTIADRSYATTMIQSIVLFNGTSWSASPAWAFEYNSRDTGDAGTVNYGDLTKITLPAGGTLSYAWGTISSCDPNANTPTTRGVISRTINANDSTGQHTWNYSGGLVTDPAGNDIAHVFTPLNASCSYYETQTKYFQGSYQSGKLLKTVNTDYQWIANPFDSYNTDGTNSSVTNVFPIRVTTIWPSGQVTKIEKDYDNFLVFSVPGGAWTRASYGNVIEEREYDYGNGAPGPLLRRTDYTYRAFDGSPSAASYLAANLIDLVSSVSVYDGSSNLVSQTTYGYDESTLQSSGIGSTQQHDTTLANPGVRGNRTSESHWLNTTSGMLTSHASYYDTGTPYQVTDPGGHVTTSFYSPGFQSGLSFSGAYVTQVQNALSQNSYFDYDLGTALRIAAKDANGQVTTWDYDFLNRMRHANAPDRGNTTWTYNDTQPPTFTASTTISTTPTITTLTSEGDLDGLGRAVHTKLTSDPDGTDSVDTTYDGVGRVSTVSNPHRATVASTDGVTTSVYDALGRVTQLIAQDGSVTSTDYSQFPIVTITDPAGNPRASRTDALGRLIEVDEPGDPANFVANNYGNLALDGNFAVFGPAGDIKWQTNTHGATNTFYSVNMMDDGNLIKYTPTWNTATPTTTGTATYGTQACVGYRLFSGQTLASGACLQSLNKRFMLVMQTAGNLVQYDLSYSPAHAIFYNSTTGTPGSYLAMQGDGNLVIYTASGSAVWSTGSVTGTGSYMLQVQDPGNLVIYRDIWETGTSQAANGVTNFTPVSCSNLGPGIALNQNIPMGSCLISSNGRFALLMQTDGNLVVYDRSANPLSAIWNTGTGIVATPLTPGVALQTLYSYDALGNLLRVDQKGTAPSDSTQWRTRLFTYDSLSRLLTASNPESNTAKDASGNLIRVPTVYAYDADGNLLQKTSPAPNQTGTATQTISYCYDAVHRVVGKAYSAQSCPLASPVVTYTYDQGTNGVGRLTHLSDQAGTGDYTFDNMGRIISETRVINGISKGMSYDYNLDGSLARLHYPSNRVVTYTPDAAGHTVSAADSNGTTYAGGVTYYANGAEYQRHQPVIFFSTTLNSRLQVAAVYSNNGQPGPAFINKTYNYGPPQQNNGNITSIVANEDSSRTQTFTYDALNRITSGYSAGNTGTYSWGESYSIDAWGNLNIAPMTNKAHGGTFANASDNNNRPLGFTYDAAGNLTNTSQYVYDPENRIQTTAGTVYTYDADGQRVLKSNTSGTVLKSYWMGNGNVLAEADGSGNLTAEYVYFNGKRLVRIDLPANTAHYYLSDHLGSTSKVISAAGVVEEESDFTAFGTELTAAQGANHYKFTSKERDSESGNDYFGARYYASSMGRFLSTDPSMESVLLRNPQTWNRYSYVINNPADLVDPNGELWVASGNSGNPYSWVDQCGKGQTCFSAVAVNVSGNLRVYGSYNANDVTSYAANSHGMVDMVAVSQHHDAEFISRQTQGSEENYLGAKQGAALFNVAEAYHQAFPTDSKLTFTGGSTAEGLPALNPQTGEPLHSSHHDGVNVDLKYMSPSGNSTHSAGADVERTLFLLHAFAGQNAGLGAALTGTPIRFGLAHHRLEAMHMSHMHFQRNYPPSPKKGQ